MSEQLPDAKCVIIGAGIVGNSIVCCNKEASFNITHTCHRRLQWAQRLSTATDFAPRVAYCNQENAEGEIQYRIGCGLAASITNPFLVKTTKAGLCENIQLSNLLIEDIFSEAEGFQRGKDE